MIAVFPGRRRRAVGIGLLILASLAALLSARDYAGGWNDGSRLATVESLVDRHTLVIDDSIFVRSPDAADAPNPFAPGDELLRTQGTKDKLLIGGHYYSDKSPLPAFWLAGWYQLLQWSTGLTARQQPRLFCWLMTIVSSGSAYVVSIWSIWRLALRKGLPLTSCLLLAFSLGAATVALPYARHVNNHIILLAILSLLMLSLDRLGAAASASGGRLGAFSAGALAGLGYAFDLGLGPVLVLCAAALAAYCTRSASGIGCFALGALPWLAAHHVVNYAIGGTLGPANSVAAYLAWPGSPFNTDNMTGGWAHGTIGHFLLYAAALLFGKHGFVNYNLPLLLALIGAAALYRKRPPNVGAGRDVGAGFPTEPLAVGGAMFRRWPSELPELIFAGALSAGAWLLYAAFSNNYSGPCCSIRWFVPLLAPGYYALVVLLRERPSLSLDLAMLTAYGAVLCGWLWWRGPWEGRVPAALWPLNIAALITWWIVGARRRK